ncbi:MAG TPA: hypothetical protein VFD16_03350 [Candidatus Saccharimonadales bacterium]|nr:hypothetical protein [Candidatus Saccharimonadales bacterium]
MSKINNKNSFFGLNSADKTKIVKKAAVLANKEQLALVEKHGGASIIRDYCKCN